jgi:hypothetical protein
MPFSPPRPLVSTTARIDYFECPECECDTLEEVARAITYSEIHCFYNESHEYGDLHTEYLDCIRMQCRDCGHTIYEGFPDDLYQYLLRKGMIKGKDATGEPDSDWQL